ncbi:MULTISPECIES: hypothetical protein [unclassified Streptomyces]|uniref:hypothetical protein n=1 Tax=unclassified Streptomyces TaxID=2593676 RepID=UPI00165552F4|nr:hypothetical protein [Streptomyces sp. CB02980]MCB8903135.1 hypothetical protein [Streptomyces sp. CB02980]
MRMLNLKPIFVDHFQTLRTGGDEQESVSKSDIFTLYGLPAVLPAIVVTTQWRIGGIGDLLTALSLMSGLLFNLLVLSFDVALRAAAQVRNSQVESLATSVKIRLIRQLQANATYGLVVALAATVMLAVGASLDLEEFNPGVTGVLTYLLAHFVLVLMVILKRIRSIFRNELIP